MIYFIPAWYNPERPWYFNSRPWSEKQHWVRFDDISSHFERLSDASQQSQLIVNNYAPQLRYFMHHLELLERQFINVFDIIQGLNTITKEQGQFDFYTDLTWPDGVEFIYTPFSVLAYLDGNKYAQIEFGDSGQLFWVTFFEKQLPSLRYIFDDRGFESSRITYDSQGRYQFQEYFNGDGEWQIREFFPPYGNHVEVAESAKGRFEKEIYDTMTDLVFEVLKSILDQHDSPEDIIFLSESAQHSRAILEMKSQKKVIYSFFQERNTAQVTPEIQRNLQEANVVITNSETLKKTLQSYTQTRVKKIPLFDARLNLGQSRRLKELIIYFRLDGLEKERYRDTFDTIVRYMKENNLVELRIVSFERSIEEQQAIRKQLKDIFSSYRRKEFSLMVNEQHGAENSLLYMEDKSRVDLIFMSAADDIIKVINDSRLIIDAAEDADLYTHIAAISAGIPQINREISEFVTHKKNGYIAKNPEELYEGLDYFLSEMTNWNLALTDSIQKVLQHSNTNLLSELMEGV